MKNLEAIIKAVIEAKAPVNNGTEVVDLETYEIVYEDGQWSDSGIKVFYSITTKAMLLYSWSKWQGADCTYRPYTLQEYIGMMPTDEDHFNRWTDGLRSIVVE